MILITPRLIRTSAALLLAGAAAWFLFSVRSIFVPFIWGFLIAYIFDPLVDRLEEHKIPRAIAIILVYLVVAGFLILFLVYAFPALFRDLNRMAEDIPQYAAGIQKTLAEIELGYNRVPIPAGVRAIADETIAAAENVVLGVLQSLAHGIMAVFSQAFNLVLAPILSYYFLREFGAIGSAVLPWIPARMRPEIIRVGAEINRVIKQFIRGNLLVAFLVGIMAGLGMYLVGMDYPLLIGALVGVTNFIPYFGAFISAVPVVLLALVKSKWLALYVLGVMLAVQQIEGNIISPKILGGCVGLHPLTVIFALLAGGKLLGVGGLLLAVPAAAIIKILGKHLYHRLI